MPLNIEYIQKKVEEGYRYTRLANNQNLILLLGRTGAGKSTTANYLLGKPMVEGEDHHGRWSVVVANGVEPAFEIGLSEESCTLYARPDSHDFVGGVLTDCPGFNGNRTREEAAIESLSMELTIRNARQIKAFLILAPYNDFTDSKIKELFELVGTLARLFKNPAEMIASSIFLITKTPEGQNEARIMGNVKGGIKATLAQCSRVLNQDSSLTALDKGLMKSDYELMQGCLTELQKKLDSQTIVLNPLDGGISCEGVMNRIKGIQPRKKGMIDHLKGWVGLNTDVQEMIEPITINDFNFSKYDNNRKIFDESMLDLAYDASQLIREINDYDKEIKEGLMNIEDSKQRIEAFSTYLGGGGGVNSKSVDSKVDKEIALWSKLIKQGKETKEAKDVELENIKTNKKNMNEELGKIDVDTPKFYTKRQIDETVWWFEAFAWRSLEVDIRTPNGEEIVDIKLSYENGEWTTEDDRCKSGIYVAKYVSNYRPRPAKAEVLAFIKTKDDPENKRRILEIKASLKKLGEREIILNKEIAEIITDNQTHQKNIEKKKSGKQIEKQTFDGLIEKSKKDIDGHKDNIKVTEQKNEQLKIKLKDSIEKLDALRSKMEVLISISELEIYEPGSLVRKSVEEYKKFIAEKRDKYINENAFIITEDNTKTTLNVFMKNPVLTYGGKILDEAFLLTQFPQGELSPPYIYQDEAGIETIHFRKWHYMDSKSLNEYSRKAASLLNEGHSSMEKPTPKNKEDIKKLIQQLERENKDLQYKVETNITLICKLTRSLPESATTEDVMTLNTPSKKQQLGWNCFDVAAGINRADLVEYALASENATNVNFRRLLAPEIRNAAAITAVYLGRKKEIAEKENQSEKERLDRIAELFQVAEALKEDEELAQVAIHITSSLDDQGITSESTELNYLERFALPKSMRSNPICQLVNNYYEAHEAMREAVAKCNDALSHPVGQRLSLEQLDIFFSQKENQEKYSHAFKNFLSVRMQLFAQAEQGFKEYCENEDNYKTYVSEYYGANQWFAFQRHFAEQEATSMVDVVAHMLKAKISIYNNQRIEIYATKSYGNKRIYIQYNGRDHFIALSAPPSPKSVIFSESSPKNTPIAQQTNKNTEQQQMADLAVAKLKYKE